MNIASGCPCSKLQTFASTARYARPLYGPDICREAFQIFRDRSMTWTSTSDSPSHYLAVPTGVLSCQYSCSALYCITQILSHSHPAFLIYYLSCHSWSTETTASSSVKISRANLLATLSLTWMLPSAARHPLPVDNYFNIFWSVGGW